MTTVLPKELAGEVINKIQKMFVQFIDIQCIYSITIKQKTL